MASSSSKLLDLKKDGIVVTVDESVFDLLKVAGFLPLKPKPSSGAAVVVGLSGPSRLVPGLLVHVGQHEDISGLIVLDDHRDQAFTFGEIDVLL